MAVDWKTTGARGIPTNPYLSPGLVQPSLFVQPGPMQATQVGPGFVNPAVIGAYGSPFGFTGTDQIFGGYGFTPYMPQFGNVSPLTGSTLSPYAMAFQAIDQLTDKDLEKIAEDFLGADPLTCNADIQVQCQDHVLTLSGTVTSKLVKIAAGNDAWLVPGVYDVNNTIQIKSRTQHGKRQQTQRETVGVGSR